MKFFHTADWQMGMRAESVGKMAERVREERLALEIQVADQHAEEFKQFIDSKWKDGSYLTLVFRCKVIPERNGSFSHAEFWGWEGEA